MGALVTGHGWMMTDSEHHRLGSFTERAQQALSNVGQDDRVKQAAVTARELAGRRRRRPGHPAGTRSR
jgi:hypothetical protein